MTHDSKTALLTTIESNSYMVGGAVRDEILGRPVHDRDWVVVGMRADDMQAAGFMEAGKHFPVYLHPSSKEEYALARTERKTGAGHQGFACHFTPDVTLEEDLMRRDLTINAIAKDINGNIIDPYGGLRDIEQRLLKHVSPAFQEDPLRVFRVARFGAQLGDFEFTIAPETHALMQSMCSEGLLQELSAERVWQECHKALQSTHPDRFFDLLYRVGGLHDWFPELEQLFGVPQRADYHPEIDTGVHTLMSLQAAQKLSDNIAMRYATLVHDLGKGITPDDQLPSHRGHEKAGVALVRALSKRLKAPKNYAKLAERVCEYHLHVHRAFELKASTLHKLFVKCDAYRNPEDFHLLLLACKADARGRTGFEQTPYPQADYVYDALQASASVKLNDLLSSETIQKLSGSEIKKLIRQAQVNAIKAICKDRYQ